MLTRTKKSSLKYFAISCLLYLFAVIAAYLFGVANPEGDGASFRSAAFLTAPWFFLATYLPKASFGIITAAYGLPVFVCAAALNVGSAVMGRRLMLVYR